MSSMTRFLTDYKSKTQAHPWGKPYTGTCITSHCRNKPYHKDGIHYSCCEACLRTKQLGPFKVKFIEEDYSGLFWSKDYEEKTR